MDSLGPEARIFWKQPASWSAWQWVRTMATMQLLRMPWGRFERGGWLEEVHVAQTRAAGWGGACFECTSQSWGLILRAFSLKSGRID